MRYIAPIVEGHGEVEAVPALLHRIARITAFERGLLVNPPIRVKSGSFLNDVEYFRKQIALACAKAAQEDGTVLILLDCEDDCPGTLGPDLLRRAQAVRADVDILVVLARREFESWFLAGIISLRGRRGIPHDLDPPPDLDGIRDAKGWLGQHMNVAYDPISHQLEFARAFDLEAARSNRSFDSTGAFEAAWKLQIMPREPNRTVPMPQLLRGWFVGTTEPTPRMFDIGGCMPSQPTSGRPRTRMWECSHNR